MSWFFPENEIMGLEQILLLACAWAEN